MRFGPMRPETRAKLSESQRLRHPPGSTWDTEPVFAAIRQHPTLKDAAAAVGISAKALQHRIARLERAGMLPADIAAIRQKNIERPNHNRPKQKPKSRVFQRRITPRWIPPHPSAPEPRTGPVVVTELPSPAWPLPKADEPVNEFNQRRIANARARAEQVWRERTGGEA